MQVDRSRRREFGQRCTKLIQIGNPHELKFSGTLRSSGLSGCDRRIPPAFVRRIPPVRAHSNDPVGKPKRKAAERIFAKTRSEAMPQDQCNHVRFDHLKLMKSGEKLAIASQAGDRR
jgi:hypothetical protein